MKFLLTVVILLTSSLGFAKNTKLLCASKEVAPFDRLVISQKQAKVGVLEITFGSKVEKRKGSLVIAKDSSEIRGLWDEGDTILVLTPVRQEADKKILVFKGRFFFEQDSLFNVTCRLYR